VSHEIMWKNFVDLGRPQTKKRMRIACWIPKATEYVILITFPLQQLLRYCMKASHCYVICKLPVLLGVNLNTRRFFCSTEKNTSF
jgi:hypothetical protein